jgi:hypothetical protein
MSATLSNSPVLVARVALKAAEAALPTWMSARSRHDGCTFPQLAACLVLRGFWKTSLRGVEAHLRDLADVRAALGLPHVPDHNALWRAHGHLEPAHLEALTAATVALAEAAHALPQGQAAALAADSTGLTHSRAAHYAAHTKPTAYWRARRKRKARGLRVARLKKRPKKSWHYPKWTPAIDRLSHFVLAQAARRGPYPDPQEFAPLVLDAHLVRPSVLVLADKGFESEANLQLCEEWTGARAVMRIKRPRKGARLKTPYRAALLEHLPPQYAWRACAESFFSADKRRFGDLTPSRSWRGRITDTLLRGVLHNCALLMPREGRDRANARSRGARPGRNAPQD